MSKRMSRPWEKKKGIDRFSAAVGTDPTNDSVTPPLSKEGASFIQVDGMQYYSDRFYLLTPDDEEDDEDDSQPSLKRRFCSCGSNQPPPTLDRTKLIQSLDLKGAIVGTYTMVPNEFQRLFRGVPTLVLHGHKGLQERLRGSSSPNKKLKMEQLVPQTPLIKEEEEPPEEAWLKLQELKNESFELSTIHHLTQVNPAWLPARRVTADLTNTLNERKESDDDGIIVLDDSDNEDNGFHISNVTYKGVDLSVVKKRKSMRGVHHPKYMLLFETSGSLVVLVSTSNLTLQYACDGIWIQRFPPKGAAPSLKTNHQRRMDGSDFGHVLIDFLQKQSDAAQIGQMLPAEFIRHYLSLPTLDDFLGAFNFDDAQVHLIATVPGEYYGRKATAHMGRKDGHQTFLYGAQRVEDILTRRKDSLVLSEDDKLIAQPTSLGGYWKLSDMRHLAKSFMGGVGGRGNDIMDRVNIMWPTQNFIKNIRRKKRSDTSKDVQGDEILADGGYSFLSAHSFNSIDLDCIARMVQFEHSTPHQISPRAPHFKSYARLFEGNDYALRQKHGVDKAAELFSWFLMTSACLSRGAQGIPTAESRVGADLQFTYSNFELGVLFCSRLGSNTESDRIYCWKPNQCLCGTTSQKLIHLPIPYAIRGNSYVVESGDVHFCQTPYFHEVTPETACVGLMALTPYGKARAAKQITGTLPLS